MTKGPRGRGADKPACRDFLAVKAIAPWREVTCRYPAVAFGYPTVAFGYPDVAFGYPTVAFGYPKIAFGYPDVVFGYPTLVVEGSAVAVDGSTVTVEGSIITIPGRRVSRAGSRKIRKDACGGEAASPPRKTSEAKTCRLSSHGGRLSDVAGLRATRREWLNAPPSSGGEHPPPAGRAADVIAFAALSSGYVPENALCTLLESRSHMAFPRRAD